MPRSLFARTAVLIAGTILVFSLVCWESVVWTVLVPGADATAALLCQRARQALAARRAGSPLPEGVRFEPAAPDFLTPRHPGVWVRTYMLEIERQVRDALRPADLRVRRYSAPAELWLRLPDPAGEWVVLTWRVAGPGAPAATVVLLVAAAVLTLGASAWSARRLAAPLAALAAAAARLAQGERIEIDCEAGPREVRALARSFGSMAQRLADLDQQRELMLGGLSHDLRTPLARLRVAVELLDASDTALAGEITANIEEMDRLIGQFLHYARANYREAPSLASLDEVVRNTLGLYASDTRVVFEPGAAVPRAFAQQAVRRMVLNLVQNALDYGRPPVAVRTRSRATEIGIDVQDRGAGLGPQQWARALQPFDRGGRGAESAHAGLGLALVARLVQAAGGQLEARQSTEGFCVTVTLPVAGEPDLSPVPPSNAAR